jgi:hypothetical protein
MSPPNSLAPEYSVLPLNVGANVTPEEVKLNTDGEATKLTLGALGVPPVVMLLPGCIHWFWTDMGAYAELNLLLRATLSSVAPEENVVAETDVPLRAIAVTAVNTGDPATCTMGALAVPPVVILVPGCTYDVNPPTTDPSR